MSIRTGKRTRWGLVMDGWNSMIRYYKNNFSDGFRQVQYLQQYIHFTQVVTAYLSNISLKLKVLTFNIYVIKMKV